MESTSPAQVNDMLGAAIQHTSTNVPIAAADETIDQVLGGLRGRVFDSAAVVAVCDAGRLVGLVTIERLLAAASGARVGELMDRQPPKVAPGTDQERAAWMAVHQQEPGLAVVDEQGFFRGIIPPQRLLAVLLEEHDEDMARLGGFLASAASARAASVEGVLRRLWHGCRGFWSAWQGRCCRR